ncbi:MAG: L,D-transpeptidase family protein [Bacteroidetes bacterium]|nr:L,D-transpeptidase family protein [Bacteroidota bacterium]
MLRSIFLAIIFAVSSISAQAQDDASTLKNFQFSFNRVSQAYARYNDTLKKLFEAQKIPYPCNDIFLRFFKAHNEGELWARASKKDEYKLIKHYRMCALSGILGPKRWEGDRQVPEGYYFIEDFNPKSDFYLSLLLNYPNYSDLVKGDKDKPGGNIYIHGGCVTVGCIPMTDPVIMELYTLCLSARLAGETNIPVHIYPIRFDRTGLDFLGREYGSDTTKQKFWVNMKREYDYFETNHRLKPVLYSPDGRYLF